MPKEIIGAQGEITVIKIDQLPVGMESRPGKKIGENWIVSHSESGNHHVLTGGTVLERTSGVPEGMAMLYAILEAPAQLRQDAAVPHGHFDLPPGFYEFRISREYDPFAEQARRVAD
ncbi:MAG: hypothetical protein ACRC56_11790 [Bosea sp. (in: a-proteobacteria)]